MLSQDSVKGFVSLILDNKLVDIENIVQEREISLSINSAQDAIDTPAQAVTLSPGKTMLNYSYYTKGGGDLAQASINSPVSINLKRV